MEYNIETIGDIAALTPDQQVNFIKDFTVWLGIANAFPSDDPMLKFNKRRMIWKDDGDYGILSGFRVDFGA